MAVNYVLGGWLARGGGYRLYCLAFALLWAGSVYATKHLSERWFWAVSDREPGSIGGFRKAGGGGGAGFGASAPLTSQMGAVSGGLATKSGSAGIGSGMAGYGNLDEDDDETEAFVAEL